MHLRLRVEVLGDVLKDSPTYLQDGFLLLLLLHHCVYTEQVEGMYIAFTGELRASQAQDQLTVKEIFCPEEPCLVALELMKFGLLSGDPCLCKKMGSYSAPSAAAAVDVVSTLAAAALRRWDPDSERFEAAERPFPEQAGGGGGLLPGPWFRILGVVLFFRWAIHRGVWMAPRSPFCSWPGPCLWSLGSIEVRNVRESCNLLHCWCSATVR